MKRLGVGGDARKDDTGNNHFPLQSVGGLGNVDLRGRTSSQIAEVGAVSAEPGNVTLEVLCSISRGVTRGHNEIVSRMSLCGCRKGPNAKLIANPLWWNNTSPQLSPPTTWHPYYQVTAHVKVPGTSHQQIVENAAIYYPQPHQGIISQYIAQS